MGRASGTMIVLFLAFDLCQVFKEASRPPPHATKRIKEPDRFLSPPERLYHKSLFAVAVFDGAIDVSLGGAFFDVGAFVVELFGLAYGKLDFGEAVFEIEV